MNKYIHSSIVLRMLRSNKHLQLIITLLFITMLLGCPNPNDPEGDGGTADYLSDIEGTWQDTESARSFTINSLHVLFQYPNPVPPGNTVTYGNFQYVSYNGTTVCIYDYDDEIVSFIATIENDILTVSGLNTIKIFDDPFDSRDYRPWNSTYTR